MTFLELNTVPSLSLVLPCFNEQESLTPLVEKAAALLPELSDEHEIIIVNDGSRDGTRDTALALAARFPAVQVVDIPHGGYGAALDAGLAKARFDWVACMDADGQYDLDDLPRLLALTGAQACVLGFREPRAETGLRRANQFLLKVWAYVLLGIPWEVKDIGCGFRLLSRGVLADARPLRARGAIASAELVRAVLRFGLPVAQAPVRHLPRQHGRATGGQPLVVLKAMAETLDVMILPAPR